MSLVGRESFSGERVHERRLPLSTGSLILGIVAPKYTGGHFGAEMPFFEQLARRARTNGHRLVIVHPRTLLRWKTGDLRAKEFMDDTGEWAQVSVPRLDAVVRKYGEVGGASKYRKLQKHIPFLNPYEVRDAVTDKHFFASLMQQGAVPHPETRKYSRNILKEFIQRHPVVFIKPRMGTLGQNTIQIVRKGSGVKLRYKRGSKVRFVRTSLSKAPSQVEKAIARLRKQAAYSRFIIQQGIRVATYERRPFSVRIVVHKRPGKEPVVAGSQARVGFLKAVTDNQGAAKYTSFVLERVFPGRRQSVEQRCHEACFKAFDVVNRHLRERTGQEVSELGFDVVFDNSGAPFVIEANSRPQILRGEPLFNTEFMDHVINTAVARSRTARAIA